MEKGKRRIPLWLPYVSQIETKKTVIAIQYKGGHFEGDIKTVLSIMLYGGTCPIPEDFLSVCARYRVPICIHRRTMSNAIWITPSIQTSAKDDIVTRQILFRENEKKRVHITKQILRAKFKSMTWLVAYPRGFDGIKLTVAEMVNIEAQHAKRYWDAYFSSLGFEQYSRRGNKNTLKSVLDAVSKLISGIVLRYIIYHRMSPYHGFIHVPTDYPSLVYDLVEPYRGYIDKTVFNTVKKAQELGIEEKDWLAHAITSTEDYLDTMIYTETTRQIVSFQELLHGAVLGLRAYLLNESKRYLVPIPGNPSGGRPRKAGYRLYGRSAGPTDFWQVAESASITHKKIMSGDT